MALIICPECNGKISDQATTCPHCGYPLQNNKQATQQKEDKSIQNNNIEQIQVSFIPKKPMYFFSLGDDHIMIECGSCGKVYKFKNESFSEINNDSCISNKAIVCPNCRNGVKENSKIKEKNIDVKQKTLDPVQCPRCGSTQITTGARGVNHFFGFIGASKTVNRCANCGNTWTPKKR